MNYFLKIAISDIGIAYIFITDGILVELWRTGGFHYGWRFYQIAPDGYHIKLLDNISEYTKYEGEVYYYSK